MAKYINVDMAKQALEKGLNVWTWNTRIKAWYESNLSSLTYSPNTDTHFAIGEKPTSPPRKMIEIDGVRMPAPITQKEALVLSMFFILDAAGGIERSANSHVWVHIFEMGNAFTTEADAIAARDARKLILERAMERAK